MISPLTWCAVLILGTPPNKDKATASLDVGVAVDAGRDRVDDFVHDMGISGELADLLLVLVCQAEAGELVVGLDHVVGLENGGEDGEAVPVVQLGIVVVAVDAGDLDFLAGLGLVDEDPRAK